MSTPSISIETKSTAMKFISRLVTTSSTEKRRRSHSGIRISTMPARAPMTSSSGIRIGPGRPASSFDPKAATAMAPR